MRQNKFFLSSLQFDLEEHFRYLLKDLAKQTEIVKDINYC